MRVRYSFLDRAVHKFSGYRLNQILRGNLKMRNLYDHEAVVRASNYSDIDETIKFFPSLVPNWDHSPRSREKASVIINNTPELFKKNLENCFDRIKHHDHQERIIIIKAWNEWGEGNYLEPDGEVGFGYLREIKDFQNL